MPCHLQSTVVVFWDEKFSFMGFLGAELEALPFSFCSVDSVFAFCQSDSSDSVGNCEESCAVDSAASSDFLAVSVTTVCAILLLATGLDVKLVGSFGLEEALGGP